MEVVKSKNQAHAAQRTLGLLKTFTVYTVNSRCAKLVHAQTTAFTASKT